MPIRTILFDLDDTLYPPTAGIWTQIRERMNAFMREQMGLPEADIPRLREHLYTTYGTTLRGLEAEYQVEPAAFLAYVHNVPVEQCLRPAPRLRAMLLALPQRRLVFTNADTPHAERVIRALGLDDCFERIIDIHQIAPACKPMPAAFETALALAGSPPPADCLFIDDAPRNLRAAHQVGLRTALVGAAEGGDGIDLVLPDLLDLPAALERWHAQN